MYHCIRITYKASMVLFLLHEGDIFLHLSRFLLQTWVDLLRRVERDEHPMTGRCNVIRTK